MRSTISRVGKYELKTVLARTATSVVYDGWDSDIARRVAVKVIPASAVGGGEDADSLARFKRGARAAGQLTHPNIVGVYDYGESDDHAFIVMEYIDGPTLKERFDTKQAFSLSTIYAIAGDILNALQYSHDRGVVHRDMKPANIMFTSDGVLKITDFGIARLEDSSMTQTGIVIGTPAYMSPEQFIGEKVDWRTDIYSTGAVLYEMLTSERPYEGNLATIMHKTLYTPAPRPSRLSDLVTPALDQIVTRAMAKKPEDRFQSAREASAALQALHPADGTGVHRTLMAPAASRRPDRRPVARQPQGSAARRYLMPVGVAAAIGAVALGGWFALSSNRLRGPNAEPTSGVPGTLPPKTVVTEAPPPIAPPRPAADTVLPTPPTNPAALPPTDSAARLGGDPAQNATGGGGVTSAPTQVLTQDLPDATVSPLLQPPVELPKPPPRRTTEMPSFGGTRAAESMLKKSSPNQTRAGVPLQEQAAVAPGPRLDRTRPSGAPPKDDTKESLLPSSLLQKNPAVVPTPETNPAPPRYASTSINGALGLVCQLVTSETASSFGLDAPRGIAVTGVLVGSIAYNAGIHRDDVIVKVGGAEISDAAALSVIASETAAGRVVPVELIRNGAHRVVQLKANPSR